MSQGDIMKVLGKLGENEWISTTELTKLVRVNRSTVTSNLIKLRRYNEIESRRLHKQSQNASFEHRLTWEGKKNDTDITLAQI